MGYDTNRTNVSLSQIGVRAPNTAPAVGSIIYVPAAGGGWAELAISVPAANVRNALGIDNAETAPSWKTTLDATNPAAVSTSAAAPGTSLIYSHRDHVHLITVSGVDHGGLGGLVPDDDHTQYALLAGRGTGQTLIGGTGSGNDLTLQSTSHATKGSILIPDGEELVLPLIDDGAGNYERLRLYWNGNDAVIIAESAGTGVPRNFYFESNRDFILKAGVNQSVYLDSGGSWTFRDRDAADATRMWLDTAAPGILHIDQITENTSSAGVRLTYPVVGQTATPPTAVKGMVYYDTDDDHMYLCTAV